MQAKRHIQQFTKYGSAALGSAATDWLLFTTLIFNGVTSPLAAQILSRIGGGIFSFAVNGYWCFNSEGKLRLLKAGRRFLLLYGFSYCLSISLFLIFLELLGVPAFLAKLSSDMMILIINYIVMHNYVFHGRDGLTRKSSIGYKKLRDAIRWMAIDRNSVK